MTELNQEVRQAAKALEKEILAAVGIKPEDSERIGAEMHRQLIRFARAIIDQARGPVVKMGL
jgi:hypothetical protein